MLAVTIILVLMVSLTATLGNSLLKAGASGGGRNGLLQLHQLPRAYLHPAVIGGICVYGFSQVLWMTLLRILDLSVSYPLQIGLNFVFIMLVARWHFREPLTPGKLMGMGLILAGIITVAAG